jgi:hypothetical protein
MSSNLIDLTEETATIIYDTYQEQGSVLEFEINMPEEILLESFIINGVVTKSDYIHNNGSSGYLTKMMIGDLSAENRKILSAYVIFLKQERVLDEIYIDCNAIQNAISKFEKCFLQVVSIAEQLNGKSKKKNTTLH